MTLELGEKKDGGSLERTESWGSVKTQTGHHWHQLYEFLNHTWIWIHKKKMTL